MQRLRSRAALSDTNRNATTHERSVERYGDIVVARHLAKTIRTLVGGEIKQLADLNVRSRLEVAPAPLEASVHNGHGIGIDIGECRYTPFLRCRFSQRLRIAHQRAQVGVFPFLDPAMRQTRRIKALEGRFP